MIKLIKLILVLIIYTSFTSLCFAAQSFGGWVAQIETRSSGYDAIYISAYGDYSKKNLLDFPDEGCDLKDRGIIRETDPGAKTMLRAVFMAYDKTSTTFVRVDGCTPITPDVATTAPRIVAIHIY